MLGLAFVLGFIVVQLAVVVVVTVRRERPASVREWLNHYNDA